MATNDRPIVTPLISFLGRKEIYLKDESRQLSGAFKYRGAFARLSGLKESREVVAASTGNHGIAVGLAASRLGHCAHIFLPRSADPYKLRLIRETNADVVIAGEHLDECAALARDWAETKGALWISGYDDPSVIEGNREMFREIMCARDQINCMVLPVGGGGLLAAALLECAPSVEIVAVQNGTADSLTRSLQQGRPVRVTPESTVAGGLAVPQIGRIAFEMCSRRRPQIVSVNNADIVKAMKCLWDLHQIRAEAAGAAALAGTLLLNGNKSRRGIACVISGGNIDHMHHARLVGN